MKTWIQNLSIITTLVLHISTMSSSSNPINTTLIQCLSHHSTTTHPITDLIYTPHHPLYTPTLNSYIHNLKFTTPTTPKPILIITPTHTSHIQASIFCAKLHGVQIRIRSGGHDYDGLSYVSDVPFIIVDMFKFKSVNVNLDQGTAWVQSGATLGEVFYEIAVKSNVHGFPAGVCPTVGAGGHFSGGGYGNMMRKFGLSVDNIVDAEIVVANGEVMDRKSMGEDLFWAIRGGGGASFGIIVSWKINLVPVPSVVTVFRIERTLEQGLTDIVYKWQHDANTIDDNLFIRIVLLPLIRKDHKTVKGKFVALFLGNADTLLGIMNEKFSEMRLWREDCVEMSWIESVLFWANYPNGTSTNVLLEREAKSEKYLKKKSDYVKEPISKANLEGIWKTMIELKKPALTFNPYGGRMSEISEFETPMPHRKGNLFKIQYSVTWKEGGDDAAHRHLDIIRRMYSFMTPYVSKSPRCAYLNYRDTDLGINRNGNTSYEEAKIWGGKYFNNNFDRLVEVKSRVDPDDFFRYEQSIPSLAYQKNVNSAQLLLPKMEKIVLNIPGLGLL